MNNTSSQWYNSPPGQFPRFDDIPVGPIDSVTAHTELYLDGEWFNTFARLYNYRVRLPYLFDYKFWTSYVGSGKGWATARNQRRTVTKNGYEYVPQFIYNQGMMYGQDGNGYVPKFIYKNRILFMSDNSIINASNTELNGLVVNMFSSAVGAWQLYGDWHAGYFGTVTPAELFTFNTPTAQGFFLDTGPGPQKLVENNTTYRYWIAAVKDGERVAPGTPLATLPGDATSYEDNAALDSIEIYRKTPGNATIDVNRAYRGLIMPITLHFAQRKPQPPAYTTCPWCDRGRYLDSSKT
ncbi:hypothetical protein SPFM9_00136 [Salmonella phage SPFM9]|nr:hypothetical protein SPFM9_00136 [Salmonella phage SPFM9]